MLAGIVCSQSAVLPVCSQSAVLSVCSQSAVLSVCSQSAVLPVCSQSAVLPVCSQSAVLPVCSQSAVLSVCSQSAVLSVCSQSAVLSVCSQSALCNYSQIFNICCALKMEQRTKQYNQKAIRVATVTIIMLRVFYFLHNPTNRMLQTAVTFCDGPLGGQSSLISSR
jgi:hypothetical protein